MQRKTNFDYTHLAHIEKGRATGSRSLAECCDAVLGANGELLAAFDSRTHPREVSCAATTGERDARFNAALFITPAMRWLTASMDDHPEGSGERRVGEPHVDTICEMTATFRTLDNRYGGAHIHDSVLRYLDQEVTPLLRDGRYTRPIGRSLFAAAAELIWLAGWTSYDGGWHGLAQQYFIRSLQLATAAGDGALGTEILAAMSHQSAYLRSPVEAVDLARAAHRSALDAGIAALRAEASVMEAHGLALTGDEKACATALARAEDELDQAERDDDPQWIGYFDDAYLAARFGHCFVALGRGDLAQRFAARSLDMDRSFRRGRQFNLALLAVAHVQAGEPEQAATVGMDAVTMAEQLNSARCVDYLRALADRLAPHVGLASVDEFLLKVEPAIRSS